MTDGNDARDFPRIPEIESDYELVRELGRGGTAIVYLARDRELGRNVAIKLIRPGFLHDEEAVARLLREARTVGGLQHPNIVTLLGTRRFGKRELALILEFVPGRTLRERLDEEGALPIPEVEGTLRDLGSALSYAHRRRIVHRDLKPENVYVDDEAGVARLADFGIARSWEGGSELTLPGSAIGTPMYMSPEQVDGVRVDGRSDLYSLGLLGWEMLTGRRPWAGESLYGIIYKQKHEALPDVRTLRPDAPAHLCAALRGALAKDPAERWRNAGEFLEAMTSGSGIPSRAQVPSSRDAHDFPAAIASLGGRGRPGPTAPESPAPSSVRYRRPRRRSRRARGSWVAALLVLLVAGVGTAAVVEGPDGPIRAALGPVRSLLNGDPTGGSARAPADPEEFGRVASSTARGGGADVADLPAGTPSGIDATDLPPEDQVLADTLDPEDPAPDQPETDSDPPAPGVAARMEVVSEHGSVGIAGRALGAPVAVRVVDPEGRALSERWTRFVVTAEGAAVSPDSALTDSQGVARTNWVLGRSEGRQELVAFLLGGEGLSTRIEVEARLPALPTRVEVVAGGTHTCRLQSTGVLSCWGDNSQGQVGEAEGQGRSVPRVSGTTFARVSTGLDHTCALTTEREAWCWGANHRGQLGDGGVTPRAAPTAVAGAFRFEEIQAGANHTCGLTPDRRVLCWGANDRGQLGDGTFQSRTTPTHVNLSGSFRALAVGWNHTCALDVDGVAHCWGANGAGEVGSPGGPAVSTPVRVSGGHRFRGLSAGNSHTCGLTATGGVLCWGENSAGQLGDGSREGGSTPARVMTREPFTAVVAGAVHTCGLGESGMAYCWGRNVYGQLGDGSTTDRHQPVPVEGGYRFQRLHAFGSHTCGPSSAGSVLCWGYNAQGQLGDGSRRHSTTPVPVAGEG
jgi:alpha-tubulin suppressor-like RCC1 family protein